MPSPLAALLTDTPSSLRLSPISSPGWGGFFISTTSPSMIVDKVDINGLAVLEPENDPPVRSHGHRPIALEVARQGMEPERRNVHLGNFLCGMHHTQNLPDLESPFGLSYSKSC